MRKSLKGLLLGTSTYAVVLLILSSVPLIYAQNGIAVTTDKDSFSPGDTVSVIGTVDGAPQGTPVGIEVKDADGATILIRTATTDSEGRYELTFKVPATAASGTFMIFANAEVGGEKVSNVRNISVGSAGSGSSSSGSTSGCLIATAAFGSELTPQVQFLRNFRDGHIMSTGSGSSFMTAFNAWYYSFSPSVADYEREQPWLQQTVKVVIYPLLGILQVAEKGYSLSNGEGGAILAGFAASSLIGMVYLSPAAITLRKRASFKKLLVPVAGVLVASLGMTLAGVATEDGTILVYSTALFVLASMAMGLLAVVYLVRMAEGRLKTR